MSLSELDSYKWAKETVKKYEEVDRREASGSGRSKSDVKKRYMSPVSSSRGQSDMVKIR